MWLEVNMNNFKNSSSIWFSWFTIFRKKFKSSFTNCQSALQIANCEWLIRTLLLSGGLVQPENTYFCILKVTGQTWESQKRISIKTNHSYQGFPYWGSPCPPAKNLIILPPPSPRKIPPLPTNFYSLPTKSHPPY